MPRLDKMSFEEHVSISKKMFYGGFAFLPFLWLVNFMYFYKTSQLPNAPSELKKCCIIWFILLTTWYAIFVNKRVAWSTDVDGITVVIPKGV
ncbi:hypothetical protein RMATCC62417_16651 [Rhizopus microsporus]|nr:hypothetical protein RMATCC62417_16651 [Rhizopus microsporus]